MLSVIDYPSRLDFRKTLVPVSSIGSLTFLLHKSEFMYYVVVQVPSLALHVNWVYALCKGEAFPDAHSFRPVPPLSFLEISRANPPYPMNS